MVSPGSRSTPMAVALLRNPLIRVEMFHDERSASFAALGAGLATGVPAVVLCSSGTAATHFHAAVVEAHQSNVPMIVCTADRPPHLRDVAAPQTIDQTRLYGDAVRWFHDPGVPDPSQAHTWRALASRAYSATDGSRPGPVHLNLPFDEPLYGEPGSLPAARDGRWSRQRRGTGFPAETVSSVAREISGLRGIFVAGRGAPASLTALAEALGWPVLADSRAAIVRSHPLTITHFDPVLRSSRFAASHLPDIVVQVGEPPASKVLSQWLKTCDAPMHHWSEVEMVSDPLHLVTSSLRGDIGDLARRIQDCGVERVSGWGDDWAGAQLRASRAIDDAVAHEWSEVALSRTVSRCLPDGCRMVVSSSMPVRDLEWFGRMADGVTVHANRGANGIDGVIATGVGVAAASAVPTFVLIGDVALLHDASSLTGLSARQLDLRIVVTNNDGGSIFSFLPQAGQVTDSEFEVLYGTPHGVDFASLSRAHGIEHVTVSDVASLESALRRRGPVMIEARFDRASNVAVHEFVNGKVVEAIEAHTA